MRAGGLPELYRVRERAWLRETQVYLQEILGRCGHKHSSGAKSDCAEEEDEAPGEGVAKAEEVDEASQELLDFWDAREPSLLFRCTPGSKHQLMHLLAYH